MLAAMRSPLVLLAEGLPGEALALLEASAGAALLIDVGGGRLVAVNGKGAALLGVAAGTAPLLLDAAMPGLARLKALSGEDRPSLGEAAEKLVLWGARGAVRLSGRVRLFDTGGRTLAAVAADRAPAPAAEASAGAPALCAGDDAAKLKEIARRIRDGQAAAAARQERRAPRERPGGPAVAALAAAEDGTAPAPLPAASVGERASLAHELKTPLAAIQAAAEIMRDERLGPLGSPRYVGYAADIHASAAHLLSVIERMLAEGRAAGEAELAFAEIDAGAVLAATVSQLAPLAERAGLALALELAPRLPHLVADATSLRQMVLNLVTNALKFTPSGGTVTVAARYGGDGPLVIAVSDTGSGMSRREIEGALGRGRAPRREKRVGTAFAQGLGLGLPLVAALAHANGAELVIESAPGAGTSASLVFGKDRVIPV